MAKRFYAECTEPADHYCSERQRSWQVFDRLNVGNQGDSVSVAMCLNKHYAYKVRDALNSMEESND